MNNMMTVIGIYLFAMLGAGTRNTNFRGYWEQAIHIIKLVIILAFPRTQNYFVYYVVFFVVVSENKWLPSIRCKLFAG